MSDEFSIRIAERTLYDEGWHPGIVRSVEGTKGQYGPQFLYKIGLPEIEREDGQEAYVSYYTPQDISPTNKLGVLWTACRLEMPETDIEVARISGRDPLNKPLRVRLKHSRSKKDGLLYANVDELDKMPRQQAVTMSQSDTLAMPPPVTPAASKSPKAEAPADETLPRMRLRNAWELLAKKAAIFDFAIGYFPTDKSDAEIAAEIAAHKKVVAAMEEDAEVAEPDVFASEA